MSKLKKAGLSVRVISLILALATLAVILGIAAPEPVAADRCGTEFIYYSDASFTEVVGVQGWLPYQCNCQHYQWGDVTFFREIVDSFC